MLIGICDDDKNWCKNAKRIIEEYAMRIEENIEVKRFYSCDEIFEYGKDGNPALDVIFMDIELSTEPSDMEMNGIQVASKINGIWKHCQIVYLTNYLFYATEIHHTKHCFFVLKEQFAKKVGEVFEKILHELEQSSAKYVFEAKGGVEVVVAPEDIRYFEREKRQTKLVTTWGDYEVWEKIGEIGDTLSKLDFVRCHNSYIVYLPAIRELKKEEIVMENGACIPVSRNYRKLVKSAFARWALTQMM